MGLDKAGLPPCLVEVLSEKNVRDLAAGADPATVETLSGESVLEVMQVGSPFADLVYTPVTPCRLVNTLNAGGAYAGGESRNYDLIGPANYSSIGGNPAGCGIPGPTISGGISYNAVRALNLNYISVGPAGPGDFRAWPTNQAVPLASVLNYANVGAGLNIANGLVTTTCTSICLDLIPPFINCLGDPCPAGDLSVQADVSGTHLIIDFYGYFAGADTSIVRGSSSEEGVTANVTLVEGACVAIASCSVVNSSSSAVGVVVLGSLGLDVTHALGTDDLITATLSTTSASCVGSGPGSSSQYHVNVNVPSGLWQGDLYAHKRFSLAGSASATYYLNVRQDVGGGDAVDFANVICLVDP